MIDELKKYVDLLFAGTDDADDIKEEILQNTIERYEDLIAQGKTPQAAYRLAIVGIGDINEILGASPAVSTPTQESKSAPPQADTSFWRKVLRAIAVCLYISSIIPLFVLQDEWGLCGMFGAIAVATALIILSSGKKSKDSTSAHNETVKSGTNLLWTVVLAVYLLLSFVTGGWYITWIIFPIAASINGIITALTDRKDHVALRVVLYSLAILVLLGVLGVCLGIGTYLIDYEYSDFQNGTYTTGSSDYPADSIQNIHVEWASGKISVIRGNSDRIVVKEEGSFSEHQKMICSVKGTTLTVQYSKPQAAFGIVSVPTKNLIIEVPQNWSCDELQLDVASADIDASGLQINKLDLNTASGKASLENCIVGKMDVDTASGDIHYTGKVDSVSCDAASAKFTMVLANTPDSIEFDAASGSLSLTLPSDCGFTVELDTLSGNFRSDFQTSYSGHQYSYGDGRCKINVSSLSGSIQVHEGK